MTTENQMKRTACYWLCAAFISCGCSDPMGSVDWWRKKKQPELWSMRSELRLLKCWNEFIKYRLTVASPPLAIPFALYMRFYVRFPESHSTNSFVEESAIVVDERVSARKMTQTLSVFHLIQLFHAPYRPVAISDAMRDEWVNSTTTATVFSNW